MSDKKQVLTNVDVASAGSETLRKFCEYSYDIIFMELLIPELNGFEVANLIRAQEAVQNLKRTPVIALSSDVLEQERIKSKQAGMALLKSHLQKMI